MIQHMINLNWTQMKAKQNLPKFFQEYEDHYIVFAGYYCSHFYTVIEKTDPANTDQTDFETNYKSVIKELSYQEYGVGKLTTSNYDASGTGWYAWDYTLPSNMFLCGGWIYTKGVNLGDKASFQIVSGSTVVYEYITDSPMYDGREKIMKMETSQLKYLPAGLKLRFQLETSATDFENLLEYYFYKY